jgi:transposase
VIDRPGSIRALTVCVTRRRGVPVAHVPVLVVRRASELYPGEAKTDRRDSCVLADTARSHARRLHWLEVSDETLERLRVLGGYDDDLAHDVNRAANRLRDVLLAIGPALERVLGPRLDHAVARALLARYPTSTALRAAGRRRLGPLAKRHAPRMGARLVDEIEAALAAQTVAVPAEETAGRVIRELAEELDRLADRRGRLAQEIEQIFTSHPQAAVLLSIPGIGARTGARILTEIGDINRFPTAGHLAAYAGLAPGHPPVRQLDQRRDPQPARQPPAQERHVAVRLHSLHHDRSRDYYARKRSEGKLHNAAITCLARRRYAVIHATLRSGLTYGELPGPARPAPSPRSHSPPNHPLMP